MKERLGGVLAWIKWPLAIALVAYLFHAHVYTNRETLLEMLAQQVSWTFIVAAALFVVVSTLLSFLRWYLLLRAQELPVDFREACRLGNLGLLGGYVTPGTVTGDVMRGAILAKGQSSRRTTAVATILLDRILALLTMVLLAAVASLLLATHTTSTIVRQMAFGSYVASCIGLVGIVILMHPATTRLSLIRRLADLPLVGPMVGELISAVNLYQSKRKAILLALGVSMMAQLTAVASVYCCARAFGPAENSPSFAQQARCISVSAIGSVVAPVPGGVGTFEGALSYLYGAEVESRGPDVNSETALPIGWQAALGRYASMEVAESNAGPNPAVVATVEAGGAETASVFFAGGVAGVSAASARQAYGAGRRRLFQSSGFVAALLYRMLTIVFILVGAMVWMESRASEPAAETEDIEQGEQPVIDVRQAA